MSAIRKAVAAGLTGLVAWAGQVVVSTPTQVTAAEGVGLAGVLVAAFLVWLLPNVPPDA